MGGGGEGCGLYAALYGAYVAIKGDSIVQNFFTCSPGIDTLN